MKQIIEKSKSLQVFFVLFLHFGLSKQALPELASHWTAATACRGVFEMLWASQTHAAAGKKETKASESVKFSDLSDAQDDSLKDQTTSSC